MRRLLLIAAVPLLACRTSQPSPVRAGAAQATMRNGTNELVGELSFERAAGGGVRVTGEVFNLTPGAHGIHFHETGRCDDAAFESAGKHFNPDARQHGLDNPAGPHAGDLPNLTVPASGRVRVDFTTPRATLDSAAAGLLGGDGSALIIHAAADDQRTDPSGNSGARVACGVVMGG